MPQCNASPARPGFCPKSVRPKLVASAAPPTPSLSGVRSAAVDSRARVLDTDRDDRKISTNKKHRTAEPHSHILRVCVHVQSNH
eukprot:1779811-Prymnesium_polylepis.1